MDKKDGEKYKKRAICGTGQLINEFCLDLFIVTEKTWGIQNVIRTGPALFGHRFVTNRNKTAFHEGNYYPGFLPNHLEYVKGETMIKNGSRILELPEEADALALIGKGWIEPGDRGKISLSQF